MWLSMGTQRHDTSGNHGILALKFVKTVQNLLGGMSAFELFTKRINAQIYEIPQLFSTYCH